MRTIELPRWCCLICLSSAAIAQSDAGKAFEKMKALAGAWEGKTSDEHTVSESICSGCGGKLRYVATERGTSP